MIIAAADASSQHTAASFTAAVVAATRPGTANRSAVCVLGSGTTVSRGRRSEAMWAQKDSDAANPGGAHLGAGAPGGIVAAERRARAASLEVVGRLRRGAGT